MKDESKKDDLMVFVDESPSSTKKESEKFEKNVWRILITDDEQDVHSATAFALRNTKILGRRLEFLHAKSAKESVEILKKQKDIAVIILDVVMETPNAGLDLVAVIRKQLNITDSRIILRTGQPNQAPEIEVIRDYDINDYKLKSELTQTKLYAALTTAVRSYKQIRMIEAGRESLGLIVKSSAELLSQEGLNAFAQGVIVHVAGLMSVPAEGLICVHHNNKEKVEKSQIIAAAGNYCVLINEPLSALSEESARESLTNSLKSQSNVFGPSGVALYLGSDERGGMSCYVDNSTNFDEIDAGLLELFCSNIRIFADNLTLLDKLKSYAYFDQLVGLPNKISLSEKIDATLTGKQDKQFALATLLINDFSEINISLGNRYGDKILLAVAHRLRKSFPESVLVCRIARDTFALFGSADKISQDNVLEPFAHHFEIDNQEQLISPTVVIRAFDTDAKSDNDTLQEMSIVLDSAKKRLRSKVTVFNDTTLEEANLHFELLNNVKSSFELNKLYLDFQPKFCLKTQKVTGLEALVRWKKEDGEIILPANFIPLAEKSGLIIKLGKWVLRSALSTLSRLNQAGISDITMSVNISAVQLHHSDMLDILDDATNESGIPPQNVDLEITESTAMSTVSGNLSLIKEIKSRGFKLSVDDFGTGFSSLNFLRQASVDALKIDPLFVHSSSTSNGREVTEMILQLAKTLNLTVVAEGVETDEQKQTLTELGCDQAQGFFLAEPMDEKALFKWFGH